MPEGTTGGVGYNMPAVATLGIRGATTLRHSQGLKMKIKMGTTNTIISAGAVILIAGWVLIIIEIKKTKKENEKIL